KGREGTVLTMEDYFAISWDIRRDNRQAHRQRLQQNERHAFSLGGQDEDVRVPVQLTKLGSVRPPVKSYVLQVQVVDGRLELVLQFAFADQGRLEPIRYAVQGMEKEREVLLNG